MSYLEYINNRNLERILDSYKKYDSSLSYEEVTYNNYLENPMSFIVLMKYCFRKLNLLDVLNEPSLEDIIKYSFYDIALSICLNNINSNRFFNLLIGEIQLEINKIKEHVVFYFIKEMNNTRELIINDKIEKILIINCNNLNIITINENNKQPNNLSLIIRNSNNVFLNSRSKPFKIKDLDIEDYKGNFIIDDTQYMYNIIILKNIENFPIIKSVNIFNNYKLHITNCKNIINIDDTISNFIEILAFCSEGLSIRSSKPSLINTIIISDMKHIFFNEVFLYNLRNINIDKCVNFKLICSDNDNSLKSLCNIEIRSSQIFEINFKNIKRFDNLTNMILYNNNPTLINIENIFFSNLKLFRVSRNIKLDISNFPKLAISK